MTGPDLAPVAVWDATVPGWHAWPQWAEAEKWATDRELISTERGHPRSMTYRIEFYLLDLPFARAYRYTCGPDGHVLAMCAGAEVVPMRARPADVILGDLPPRHLLAYLP